MISMLRWFRIKTLRYHITLDLLDSLSRILRQGMGQWDGPKTPAVKPTSVVKTPAVLGRPSHPTPGGASEFLEAGPFINRQGTKAVPMGLVATPKSENPARGSGAL
jgi:hypothetical protein